MPPRGTDDDLTVIFKNFAVRNPAKTARAGRPIYDDMEVCEIRKPGGRDYSVFPALSMSHRANDAETGTIVVTYAERFKRQYRQFKELQTQTKSGTPLEHVPFLTTAWQAM